MNEGEYEEIEVTESVEENQLAFDYLDFSERDPHKVTKESDADGKKKSPGDDASPNSLIKIKKELLEKKTIMINPKKSSDKVQISGGKKLEANLVKIKSGESKAITPAVPEKKRVGRPPLSAAAKQLRFEKMEQKKAAVIARAVGLTKLAAKPVPALGLKKPVEDAGKEGKAINKAALVANKA